jgi:DNA-binding NarL/FixJ family response regulator
VGEAADGAEAVRLTAELAPDVVVMNIRIPGVDGIEATRRTTASAGATDVVVLTTFDDATGGRAPQTATRPDVVSIYGFRPQKARS